MEYSDQKDLKPRKSEYLLPLIGYIKYNNRVGSECSDDEDSLEILRYTSFMAMSHGLMISLMGVGGIALKMIMENGLEKLLQ